MRGLPAWLPDETFFSLVSRSHQMLGHRTAAETSDLFFGQSRCGHQHDLPNGLRAFCTRTGNVLGAESQIALTRTILPMFLPHRSANTLQDSLGLMCGDRKGALKYQLGLLTSRFRAHHPLKACLHCMQVDEASYGTPYWHLTHQFPGIWVCPEHNAVLLECNIKANGVRRFDWLLPDISSLTEVAVPESSAPDLRRFANIVRGWSELGKTGMLLSPDLLSGIYQTQIQHRLRGLTDQTLCIEFCRVVAPLRVVEELRAFAETPEQARLQVLRWIRRPRGNTHPLRYLALIFWLFETWDDFWLATKLRDTPARFFAPPRIETPSPDRRQQRLSSLLADGHSTTAAAKHIGISVQTAIHWASIAGIPTPRRAKVLKEDRLRSLVADLRTGIDKATASELHQVSIQTVTRVLRSEVGLQHAWQTARFAAAQSNARLAWRQAVERAPELGTKAWRSKVPSAYAWLYRNDCAWLKENSAPPQHKQRAQRVDWTERDKVLSCAVRAAGMALRQEAPERVLRIGILCQMVPELRAKLGHLARLPLTEEVILSLSHHADNKTSTKNT